MEQFRKLASIASAFGVGGFFAAAFVLCLLWLLEPEGTMEGKVIATRQDFQQNFQRCLLEKRLLAAQSIEKDKGVAWNEK